jgi:hypothetical protein
MNLNLPFALDLHSINTQPISTQSCSAYKFPETPNISGFKYEREFVHINSDKVYTDEENLNVEVEEGFADVRQPTKRMIDEPTPRSYVVAPTATVTPSIPRPSRPNSSPRPSPKPQPDRQYHERDDRDRRYSRRHKWNYYGGYNPFDWWNDWWYGYSTPTTVVEFPIVVGDSGSTSSNTSSTQENKDSYEYHSEDSMIKYGFLFIIIILLVVILAKVM